MVNDAINTFKYCQYMGGYSYYKKMTKFPFAPIYPVCVCVCACLCESWYKTWPKEKWGEQFHLWFQRICDCAGLWFSICRSLLFFCQLFIYWLLVDITCRCNSLAWSSDACWSSSWHSRQICRWSGYCMIEKNIVWLGQNRPFVMFAIELRCIRFNLLCVR